MISLLETVLRRPRTVLVLMIALIAVGIVSYINIPKESSPDIDIPVLYVSVSQFGVSPEDAERLLVRPIETELRGIDGLKEMTAIASESHAGIVLEFDIAVDIDQAITDTKDKVQRAKEFLPDDASEPTINETNFALIPTVIITLSGDVPERTLYQHARILKEVIESIDTVRSAELNGHREEILEVLIDTLKLESYSVTQQELLSALNSYNQLVPAGSIESGSGKFNVKVPGLIESSEDAFNIPIKQNGDSVVTLGDLAEIKRTFVDPNQYTTVNGRPAISLEVTKRLGTNIIENNIAVRAAVEAATADWPKVIKIDILSDQSKYIFDMLGSLQSAILTAIFLVMILVVAALGLKSALLVGLAIPTSFMMGFFILSMLGMTVNSMVMFSLVICVGMLVDGAIVIVEYADRKIHEGMEQTEAYIRAAKLMFWPIFSSTATTLAAFVPLLFWPGVAGEFMSYLPIMVIIVLSGSLVTAMIFLPVTGGVFSRIFIWLGNHAKIIWSLMLGILVLFAAINSPISSILSLYVSEPIAMILSWFIALVLFVTVVRYSNKFLTPLVGWSRKNAALRAEKDKEQALLLSSGGHFDAKKVPGITGLYVRFLKLLAGNPIGNIVAIVSIFTICVVIVTTFTTTNKGVEFFVEEEPDLAVLFVSGRGNLSVNEANALVSNVERIVLNTEGIESVVNTTYAPGGGGGGDFLSGTQDKPSDAIGEMNLELSDFCCRRKAEEIFQEIRDKSAELPGIKVIVKKIEGGPPTGTDVQLEVRSSDYQQLVETVEVLRGKFDNTDLLLDIEDDRPLPGIEWRINIDRELAGRYQADIASVGGMIQLVTNGVLIGKYRPNDSDDEVEIRARLPQEQRSIDQFENLRLQTSIGQVPLGNFIKKEPQKLVTTITKRDGSYSMFVKARVDQTTGVTVDQKVNEIETWLASQTWPENIQFRFRGADEDQQESQEFLITAMIASLFLMFLVLLTQFNSFYQTIITLMTVVLSFMGVLLGLILTGHKFSIVMTGVGVVALAGIVVNNAIVLIDTYNRFRKDGVIPLEAALKSSAQRIRPVLLTTITTIAGLIPMATQFSLDFINRVVNIGHISSVIWVQLSTAIISGLAFSTILTLIVIPTMLSLPSVWSNSFSSLTDQLSDRRARRAERRRLRKMGASLQPEPIPVHVESESIEEREYRGKGGQEPYLQPAE